MSYEDRTLAFITGPGGKHPIKYDSTPAEVAEAGRLARGPRHLSRRWRVFIVAAVSILVVETPLLLVWAINGDAGWLVAVNGGVLAAVALHQIVLPALAGLADWVER